MGNVVIPNSTIISVAKRSCIQFILVVLVFSIQSLALPGGSISEASTCNDRFAILLAGYGTSYIDVAPTFYSVETRVLNQIGYRRIEYFSYIFPSGYDEFNTYDAFPSNASASLDRQIKAITSNCAQARIDLIGHSLGGAVAFDILRQQDRYSESISRIDHIVTLDSPINGATFAQLVDLGDFLGIEGFASSNTGYWLQALRESDRTPSQNQEIAQSFESQIVIRTLASSDDLFVRPIDATIDSRFGVTLSLGKGGCLSIGGLLDAVLCAGHGQVLSAPSALIALSDALMTAPPRVPDKVVPVGTWIGPQSGTSTSTSIRLTAYAQDTGSGVSHVNFTAWWPGLGPESGPWIVACQLISPVREDVYECDWNFAGAPPGSIQVSFDVYDTAGNRSLAPNGTRTITYIPGSPGPTSTATYVDLRQIGPLQVAGDLRVGGQAAFSVGIKNFGTASTPPIFPYLEFTDPVGGLPATDAATPTATVIAPGQTVNFTMYRGDLYRDGVWKINKLDDVPAIFIRNVEVNFTLGALAANGQFRPTDFTVEPALRLENHYLQRAS